MSSGLRYPKSLVHHFWDYVEQKGSLDQAFLETEQRNEQRPPVFNKENDTHNLLYPPSANHAMQAAAEGTLPPMERHRWFQHEKLTGGGAISVWKFDCWQNLGLLIGLKSTRASPLFATTWTQQAHNLNIR